MMMIASYRINHYHSVCDRWRECTLNGMKSVHGDVSRRSSSMSVPPTPQTPMTPAASESKLSSLTPLTIQTGDTESQSTPDVDDSLPIAPPTPMSGEGGSLSARSSGTSLSVTSVEVCILRLAYHYEIN